MSVEDIQLRPYFSEKKFVMPTPLVQDEWSNLINDRLRWEVFWTIFWGQAASTVDPSFSASVGKFGCTEKKVLNAIRLVLN